MYMYRVYIFYSMYLCIQYSTCFIYSFCQNKKLFPPTLMGLDKILIHISMYPFMHLECNFTIFLFPNTRFGVEYSVLAREEDHFLGRNIDDRRKAYCVKFQFQDDTIRKA